MRYKLSNFNTCSSEELKAARKAIPEGTTILELSGGVNPIDKKKYKLFISKLPPSIKELSFADNDLSEINSNDLERLITYSAEIITSYDFRGCGLTNEKIAEIVSIFENSNVEMVQLDDINISLEVKLNLLLILQDNINQKADNIFETKQEPGSSQRQSAASSSIFNTVLDLLIRIKEKKNSIMSLEVLPGNLQSDKALVAWVLTQSTQFNPNAQIFGGKTLLHIASKYGYQELTQLLISKEANTERTLACGTTPLIAAASKGNIGTVNLLLKANANIINAESDDGASALTLAVERKHFALVELLIAFGANVNPKGAEYSPLLTASKEGSIEIVQALLAAGAIVNDFWTVESYECTPLCIAAECGHVAVVQALLNKSADPNLYLKSTGYPPLHIASQMGHAGVVELLLAHGAKVNETTMRKTTALMLAAAPGHIEVIKLLLNAKASVNMVNDQNYSALYPALAAGHLIVADELLNAGATFAASCPSPSIVNTTPPLEIIKEFSEQGVRNVVGVGKHLARLYSLHYLYQLFYLSIAMESPNSTQYAVAQAVLAKVKEPDLFECSRLASFKLWAFSQRKQGKSFISVDMSKQGLRRVPSEYLIEIINAYGSDLKGLDLAENFLGNGMPYSQLLATIKALPPTLKFLGLKGTCLRHVPYEQLLELFQAFPKLSQLDLRDNDFESIETAQCLRLIETLPDSLVSLLFDGNGFEISYRKREGAKILNKVEEINSRKRNVPSTSAASSEDSEIDHHIRQSNLGRRGQHLGLFPGLPLSPFYSDLASSLSFNKK